jgi:hypothetical protein
MLDIEIVEKMQIAVASVTSNKELDGFKRAYVVAMAVQELRGLLTAEYMAPIMKLQGTRLGFRTDLDVLKGGAKGPGYPMEVVRDCLIEAVLMGVQPVGNQFNIIKGGCYITKEGFGVMLKNVPGLTWKIIPSLPRIKDASAAILMKAEYTHNGVKGFGEVDIPIRVTESMGTDAVVGKATRKARAWLYATVTGSEAPEGDVMDADSVVTKSTINVQSVTHDELSVLFNEKCALLSNDELANAARIIDTKEEKSYSKLHKILSAL